MQHIKMERACMLAEYLIETRGTVRSVARHFGISKSTAHKDLTCHLPETNRTLYEAAHRILEQNKQERHLRGGLATRAKYRALRETESAGQK